MNLLINITTEPISEKHIAWFTKDGNKGNEIELYEVVEHMYPHPQVPEHATIAVMGIKSIGSFKRTSLDGATSVLLEASLNAITREQRKKENV